MPALDPVAAAIGHAEAVADAVASELLLLRWDLGSDPEVEDGELGVAAMVGGDWPVVTFDTELGLRRYMIEQRWRQLVVVVRQPLLRAVPLDIIGLAHEQRVRPVTISDALTAATGVAWPGSVVRQPWDRLVAAHFDELTTAAAGGGEVDEELLRRWVVKAILGFDLHGLAPHRVLMAARQHSGRRGLQDEEKVIVRQALAETHPDDAWLLSWALERPNGAEDFILEGARMLAEAGVVASPSPGRLHAVIAQLVSKHGQSQQACLDRVCDLAWQALVEMRGHGRKLITQSQREFRAVGPAHDNPILPSSLTHRIEQAAKAAAKGQPVSEDVLSTLHRHLFSDNRAADLEAVGHATRLARAIGALPREPSGEPAAVVTELAHWYALDGAFGDGEARRLQDGIQKIDAQLARSCEQVLDGWWKARDGLNQSFATAYLDGYPDTPYAVGCQGVHQVAKAIVQRGQPVLLLVVDGCPCADAWSVIDELVSRHRIGLVEDPAPGLALLPSLTEVSRLGLLGGSIPDDPIKVGQADELPGEESQRKAFAARFGAASKLFLQGDLYLNTIRKALHISAIPVVAVVLNAVDDRFELPIQSVGVRPVELAEVNYLAELIEEALDAGRSVLVTSDHGHTMGRGMRLRVSGVDKADRIGARVARWREGENPPDGSLGVEHDLIGQCLGERRVALLYQSGAYFTTTHAGFHGGASLEELVVPMAWLGRGGAAPEKPAWWTGDVAPAREDTPPTTTPQTVPEGDSIVVRLPSGSRTVGVPADLRGSERKCLEVLADAGDGRLTIGEVVERSGLQRGRAEGALASLIGKLADHPGVSLRSDGASGDTLYVLTLEAP